MNEMQKYEKIYIFSNEQANIALFTYTRDVKL